MKSDMENKDWLNEYVSLKQVNPANPFSVPAGYFDSLGDRIVAFKNLDELKSKGSSDGFAVPENYFEELTGNIQSRITIEESLDTETHGFAVPDGYFDNLQQQISSRVFIEDLLSTETQEFTVADGYFEQLNEKILAKTVNAGEVVAKKAGGAVIRRLYASTAFKYATAACFAVALCGGILLSELTGTVVDHNGTFLHKELSNVPVDDIQNYLELNLDPSDTQQTAASEHTQIDDKSLEDALQKDINNVQ